MLIESIVIADSDFFFYSGPLLHFKFVSGIAFALAELSISEDNGIRCTDKNLIFDKQEAKGFCWNGSGVDISICGRKAERKNGVEINF